MPEIYKDSELDAAPQKLEDLSQLTGAALAFAGPVPALAAAAPVAGQPAAAPPTPEQALEAWTSGATGQDGVALPNRFKTLRNFFWILDRPWFWLLLLLMPVEVVIRRWDQLFGAGRRRGLVDREPPRPSTPRQDP
jgi:hypothetical protein